MNYAAVPALDLLIRILEQVPAVRSARAGRRRVAADVELDALMVEYANGECERWLVAARTRPLQPKQARQTALEMEKHLLESHADYAVITAPYVSPRSVEILTWSDVGFADESGNCRLVSGPLFIERCGLPNARVVEAKQRSLYTAGAERVLRAVLDPERQERHWTIRRLADEAFPGVSVGQAHKVVKLLEEQAFLRRDEDGLVVVDAEKLLREWAGGYRFRRNEATRYYSPLSQRDLHERFLEVAEYDPEGGIGGIMASFSAAAVLAPAVRQHRFYVYWMGYRDPVIEHLQLKAVDSGENVVVYEPYDTGVFYWAPQVEQPVTCPVQTYLDLCASAARGEEAAEAVFDRWLRGAYTQ